jgi:hypothetical protein
MLGETEDLTPPSMIPPGALLTRMAQSSLRAGRAAQHPIGFAALRVPPQSEPLFADAAVIAVDAVQRLSRRPDGRAFLAKLDNVVFVAGPKPDVAFKGAVMEVTVCPGRGFAGRPSSDRLFHAALKH